MPRVARILIPARWGGTGPWLPKSMIDVGHGLAEITGAMKALDGIGSMFTYYTSALDAIADKVSEIQDRAAELNANQVSKCRCPTFCYAPFGLRWAERK
jgi:hypothetical protein